MGPYPMVLKKFLFQLHFQKLFKLNLKQMKQKKLSHSLPRLLVIYFVNRLSVCARIQSPELATL